MALRCPRLFYYRYIDKVPEPEVMVEAKIGKAVHTVLEKVLSGIQLPIAERESVGQLTTEEELSKYSVLCRKIPKFVERIQAFRRRHRVGRQLIEARLAVTRDFAPTQFYAGDAFLRGIVDVAYFYGDGNLAVVDHKTGARRQNIDVTEQLEVYAVLAVSTFRSAKRIWLGIHWVSDGELEWAPLITRAEVNQKLLPRVQAGVEAAALAVFEGSRTNPGSWCQYCSYRTLCPIGRDMRFEPCDVYDIDPGIDP